MEQFEGRVAVITGAASGIGLALATRAAREGMKVVLCDIEAKALDAAAQSLRAAGHTVMSHQLDVTSEAAVEAAAERVYNEFGAVHLLCNNAGVLNRERPTWEHTIADWQWVLSVNVWGVVHGIRAFVPRMLSGGHEGHIVNTASMAGLITGGIGTAVYDASKHAVLSLTESLYKDLAVTQTKMGASVLCPGAVTTNIFSSERNRPAALAPNTPEPPSTGSAFADQSFPPEEMASQVFDAVRANRFYVLAAQTMMFEWTKMGHDRMWEGRNPAIPRRLLAARDQQ
jgi:NAD(P)-dependent dehydrogenase (short-subunit alcohol dehydrogenase family)